MKVVTTEDLKEEKKEFKKKEKKVIGKSTRIKNISK